MRRLSEIACLGAITLAFFGCAPKPETLSGTLTVPAKSDTRVAYFATDEKYGDDCSGADAIGGDGLSNLRTDTQIQIKDGSGRLLAMGKLGAGKIADLTGWGACSFTFTVANVPTSNFYTIEVGSQKGISFSAQDLKTKNWQVRLMLASASEAISDGSNLAPATNQDKSARKLSRSLAKLKTDLEEVKQKADNEYAQATICDTQWQLYSEYAKGEPLSKECRQRFIKENGKTPEAAKAEYLRQMRS